MSTSQTATRYTLTAAAVALVGIVLLAHPSSSFAATEQTLGPQSLGRADFKPKPFIINGTAITIQQAPWQVVSQSTIGATTSSCGGSILDATHVIVAAHCVFTAANLPRPPASFRVVAGVSNVVTPAAGDVPQPRAVSVVRPHPLYDPVAGAGSPDDVAVLTLAAPLALGSPTAQAIPLATGVPAIGSPASTTGFGRQVSGQPPNGQLFALATNLTSPLSCSGPSNALYLCTASATGSACEGDSGGPLTQGASLIGVTSFGPIPCAASSINGYTNVTAGEIGAFITGDDTPPLAPRGGADVSARGRFEVGGSITCSPGTWSNNPTFQYTIRNATTGQALQSGPSPTYTFSAANVGQTVACRVSATTPGGTGIAQTEGSPRIAAAPTTPSNPRLALSMKASKRTVTSGARVSFAIRVSNRGGSSARRLVVCDTPGGGLAFGSTPKGAKRSKGRACWTISSLRAGSSRTLRITLRTMRANRTRTVTNRVTARADNASSRRASARVVARGVRRSGPAPGVTG